LRALKQRGFAHRDVKPVKLMFDGKDVSLIETGLLFKIITLLWSVQRCAVGLAADHGLVSRSNSLCVLRAVVDGFPIQSKPKKY
jgi:hypothetical protein